MPKGPTPHYKHRMEPIMDSHILASIEQAKGIHDEQGHYATLVIDDIEDYDRALEIKRALYRSRNFVKHNGELVSVKADIVKVSPSNYQVHFYAADRTYARAYILQKYGEDRSRWAYDPRAKKEK